MGYINDANDLKDFFFFICDYVWLVLRVALLVPLSVLFYKCTGLEHAKGDTQVVFCSYMEYMHGGRPFWDII